jgi:hypothetical protein
MRRSVTAFAAAIAAALAISSPVLAGPPAPIQWMDAAGVLHVAGVSANTLPASEQFPERNMKLIQPSAVQAIFARRLFSPTQQIVNGYRFQDSSQFVPTAGYRMIGILVYPTFQGDSNGFAMRGAIFHLQLRSGISATPDSQGTYIMGDRVLAVSGTNRDFTKPDSLGSCLDIKTNNTGSTNADRDTLASSEDIVLVCSAAATNMRGRLYYLFNKDGTPWRGDFLQLWVRIAHCLCSATGSQSVWGCETGNVADFTATFPSKVRTKFDIVGWM